jgi:hypothetical protein
MADTPLINYELTPLNLSLTALLALTSWALADDHATPSVKRDEALSRLKTGNERFAKSKMSSEKPVAARRAERCGAVTAALAGDSAPGHVFTGARYSARRDRQQRKRG